MSETTQIIEWILFISILIAHFILFLASNFVLKKRCEIFNDEIKKISKEISLVNKNLNENLTYMQKNHVKNLHLEKRAFHFKESENK